MEVMQKMTMNIALFTDTYTPDVNGVAKTLARWVAFLKKQGHQVRVFAPEAKGAPSTSHEEAVKRYKSLPFFLYPELQAALPNPLDVKQSLQEFKPDIIHVATPFNLGLFGRHYALKNNIPFVASYHTNLDQYLTSYKLEWAESLLEKYLYWFHKDCEKVYAPSNDTATHLINQQYPNVCLWKRGVDATLFKPIEEHTHSRESILRRYDIPPDKFTLLYVGRLATEKNLDFLLNTLNKLPQHIQQTAQMVLVGDGPMRDEIEQRMKEMDISVYLLGFKGGEELAEIYASADVFFFPSATETFGNVVLEALASGVPVIGANAGGVKELIESGHSGFLCPADKQLYFIEAIETLYTHEYLRIAFGENARNFAVTQSWDSIFQRLLDSYYETIEEKVVLV
jgi:glycosyltransferase involved in cell wall biosynthesis